MERLQGMGRAAAPFASQEERTQHTIGATSRQRWADGGGDDGGLAGRKRTAAVPIDLKHGHPPI